MARATRRAPVGADAGERVAHDGAALVGDGDEPGERLARAAVADRLGGALDARAQIAGASRDDQRRRGIEQHDVAQRAGLAFEECCEPSRVLGRLAAAQVLDPRARQTGILGRHLEGGDVAVLERGDL